MAFAKTIIVAIEISPKSDLQVPVDFRGIVPGCEQNLDDLRRRKILNGNEPAELGELFDVGGTANSDVHRLMGDFSQVDFVGAGLGGGKIEVEGSVGSHIGSMMNSGEIVVSGNSEAYTGAEMTGGVIRIQGNCGDYVGGAFPGSKTGMNRGTILVKGDAGEFVGAGMRRGLIWIGGGCEDFVGWNMKAGTILASHPTGRNIGQGMVRGTIVMLDKSPIDTFVKAGYVESQILHLLRRSLKSLGVMEAKVLNQKQYDLFHGDVLCGARGEIFVGMS